jgi:hypothetical protein
LFAAPPAPPPDSGARDQYIDWHLSVAEIQAKKKAGEKSYTTPPEVSRPRAFCDRISHYCSSAVIALTNLVQSMHGVEFELLVFPGGRCESVTLWPRADRERQLTRTHSHSCARDMTQNFGAFLKRSERSVEYNWAVHAAFRFTLINHVDASKSKDMTEEVVSVDAVESRL